jgi:hypothetical protein
MAAAVLAFGHHVGYALTGHLAGQFVETSCRRRSAVTSCGSSPGRHRQHDGGLRWRWHRQLTGFVVLPIRNSPGRSDAGLFGEPRGSPALSSRWDRRASP